jgi:hypothetical protein
MSPFGILMSWLKEAKIRYFPVIAIQAPPLDFFKYQVPASSSKWTVKYFV